MLISLIIILALFFKQYELLIFNAAAFLLSLTLAVVNHLEIFPLAGVHLGDEVFEYLIALGILCYSLELLLNHRPFLQADHVVRQSTSNQDRESIGSFFRRLVYPVGRRFSCVPDPHPPGNSGRPFWLAVPVLSISITSGSCPRLTWISGPERPLHGASPKRSTLASQLSVPALTSICLRA